MYVKGTIGTQLMNFIVMDVKKHIDDDTVKISCQQRFYFDTSPTIQGKCYYSILYD